MKYAVFTLIAAFVPISALGGLFLCSLAYDRLGIRAVRKEIEALDIPEHEKAAALLCMTDAMDADRRARIYDLSAPIVMLLALPFVKREANRLPRLFRKWDNNISINGDSGGVLMPDGRWLQWRNLTDEQWKEVADYGLLSVTYDSERYRGDAYYALGHHPRSFWARYVWLGLRNRASKLALESGRPVDGPIEVLSGSIDIGTRKAGHFLLKCGDTYHYKSAKPFRLFGFELVRIRSYGFKLEIALKNADQADRVATVAIGWSAKRWKGGA